MVKEFANAGALSDLLSQKKIVVCCGTGGVGKTTTSAALALLAAKQGKKALVITIDPAKRLATSLGLQTLGNEPQDLTALFNEELKKKGKEPLKGQFLAVVPDSEKTFEGFVRSVAGNQHHLSARVLKTSIYKIFTKEFSGAHEYMAMEKLYEVATQANPPDLIVLDTPPSANTRLFLEAPHLLAGFFDETIMKWLTAPGGKILASGVHKLMEVIEKLTGHGFISDLVEFTTSLFQLRGQFLENLDNVSKLLHGPQVSFLMVTSPERLVRADTQEFVALLKKQEYPFWGFVVNRVLRARMGLTTIPAANDPVVSTWEKSLAPKLNADDLTCLRNNFIEVQALLRHEAEAAKFLQGLSTQTNVCEVAEQPTDVHSIGALYELASSF